MKGSTNEKFVTGTPSFSEWSGCWRKAADETVHTFQEYEAVTNDLSNFLEQFYQCTWDRNKKIDLYPLGDDMGDRSQYLVINNTKLLNTVLFQQLQDWLQRYSNWRIVVPTLDTKITHIVVYPQIVRMPSGYESEGGLEKIRIEMTKYLRKHQ